MEKNIGRKAREYAIECHTSTNHFYGKNEPYSLHLEMVVNVALRFLNLVPEGDESLVLAGCWVHDTIEDCRQTYNDVKEATNEQVAELAYALTNEKGKNRAGRGSAKYYRDMKEVEYAVFIKICDRIANAQYSKDSGGGMWKMYAKENEEFEAKLFEGRYHEMFSHLRLIFKS